jgi:hypothetical protein
MRERLVDDWCVPLLVRLPKSVDPDDEVAVAAWLNGVLAALKANGHLACYDQKSPKRTH